MLVKGYLTWGHFHSFPGIRAPCLAVCFYGLSGNVGMRALPIEGMVHMGRCVKNGTMNGSSEPRRRCGDGKIAGWNYYIDT